jgi:type I restriction enzyme M protein
VPILSNFPEDKQTGDTALLFLQLIMRKLRRPVGGNKGGRCGMVVPNGVLFGDGTSARVKEELLKDFNLHTIVRLPEGVFAPYTGIPTNLLFFDRSGPTEEIWYYEQWLPEGRRSYTKTTPMQFEEFADCLAWWNKREETDRAWKIPVTQLMASGCNLDCKNPHSKGDIAHLPPEQLVESIRQKELQIAEIMGNIAALINKELA